ncbi:MAG: 3-oxoacyl-ACP reductase FabG [Clostridia bacterium]|nr:3-oxoacyl-ACP reductase FabG [Clostridia bacterium]
MRNVLITGGSRGIGAAMVRRFAATGDRVFFSYLHSEAEALRLQEETGAKAIPLDVSDSAQVQSAVAAIEQASSGVDVLVCSAGVSLNKMLMDTQDEEYARVMDTNLFGTFALIRAVLPGMFWRRSGVILTLSSIWGQEGASCEAVYSASKAAIIGLSQSVAKEAAGAGVRVNCIAPGMIDTAMNNHLSPEEKMDLAQEIPLGRMGAPEEVAETAFFLASDAAAYITGQVISVNGGWRI